MTIIGAILLVLGLVFAIKILWVVGLVLLVVGLCLVLASAAGRGVGGRHYW